MKNKIYIISDSHFGHSKMEEWALRPKGWEEKIWNGLKIIPDDGVLIHLGDVSMGADYEVEKRLREFKFKKWLVRGNHDNHSINWYLNHGWDSCTDEISIKGFGGHALLSHEPRPDNGMYTRNIHGHLHGGLSRGRPDFYNRSYHVEVCPEVVGYRPVALASI